MRGHGWLYLERDSIFGWVVTLTVNTAVFGLYTFGAATGWILALRWLG